MAYLLLLIRTIVPPHVSIFSPDVCHQKLLEIVHREEVKVNWILSAKVEFLNSEKGPRRKVCQKTLSRFKSSLIFRKSVFSCCGLYQFYLSPCDNQKVHYICNTHIHTHFISIENRKNNTNVS